MPLNFTSVPHRDISKGIDSRSTLNRLADGYSEDLVNVKTNPEGHIEKRVGYQNFGGYIPLRVLSVSRTSSTITFTLDTSIDLGETGDILIAGKLSGAQTGDWSNTYDEILYDTYVASGNTIEVTDSASGSYTDTAPQICVWGFKLDEVISANSRSAYVTSLAVYQREGEERLIATMGGTVYGLYTQAELSGQLTLPTSTINRSMTAVAGPTVLAPLFYNTLDTPTRTRGFVQADNVAGNYAVVTKAQFVSTGVMDYTITLANPAVTGSWATVAGSADQLLVTDMSHSSLNGEFDIQTITDNGGGEVVFRVANANAKHAYYDDENAAGWAGVFTDVVEVSGGHSVAEGDRVYGGPFDEDTNIIEIHDVTGNFITLHGITEAFTIAADAFEGEYTADEVDVQSGTGFLYSDMVTIGDYTREFTILEVDGNGLTLGESIKVRHGDEVTVPRRWAPIEIPTTTTYDLDKPTKTRLFDMEDFDQQSRIRTTLINDSLYLTNGVDEVMKFDGQSAYRAGIIRWDPLVTFVYNTEVPSIAPPNTLIAYTSAVAATGMITGATGAFSALQVGSKVIEVGDDGNRLTVVSLPSTTTMQVQGELTGIDTGAENLRKITSYKYYFRLNAIDVNNNIVASGVTGRDDCVIEILQGEAGEIDGGQIHIRLAGLPEFGPMDWERLELEVYKTAKDTVAPFYRNNTVQVNIGADYQYIDIYDTITDPNIVGSLDTVNTSILGAELGNAWDGPIPSKYITTVNNRLVLGHVKSWPEFDFTLRRNADSTDAFQENKATFEFLRNEDVSTGTPDFVNRFKIETVDSSFSGRTHSVSVDTGADEVDISLWFVGYPGAKVQFTAATYPTPVKPDTTYYVRENDLAAIQLSQTPFGDTIDLTAAGASVVLREDRSEGYEVESMYGEMPVTFTNATDNVTLASSTGFSLAVGDRVRFSVFNTASLPSQVSEDTDYYVVQVESATVFNISATPGGTSITFGTSAGSALMHLMDKFVLLTASADNIRDNTASYNPYKIPNGATAAWLYMFSQTLQDIGNTYDTAEEFIVPSEKVGYFLATAATSTSLTYVKAPGRPIKEKQTSFQASQVNTTDDYIRIPDFKIPWGTACLVSTVAGTLPTGLSAGTTYYLRPDPLVANAYQFFTTKVGGTAVDITAAGTGPNQLFLHCGSGVFEGPHRALVASDCRNVPVYMGPNDIADWRRWRTSYWYNSAGSVATLAPLDDKDVRWSLRVSAAVNAAMRTANSDVFPGFTPWLQAFAGSDYGTNRILFRRPLCEDGLPSVIVSNVNEETHSVFMNGLRRTNNEEVSAQEPVYPSRLLVSYKNYPEVFDNPTGTGSLDSDSIVDVNAADGEEITGVASFFGDSAFGAASLSNVAVVFKTDSIYVVDLSDDSTRPAAATRAVQKLNTQGKGCTFPDSIVPTNTGVMFANDTGIYRLNRDFSISYVGRLMEGKWRRVNKAQRLEAVAGLSPYENDYRLALPIGTDTMNTEAYRYDYEREAVDQVAGAWSRYTNYPVTAWATMDGDVYFGTPTGRIMKQRRDGDFTDYRDLDSAVDEMIVKYKPTDFGEPAMKKVLASIVTEFTVESDMDGTTLEVAVDGRDNAVEVSDYEVEFVEDADGMSDLPPRRIQTVISTPAQRRGTHFQVIYKNSSIDEPVVLAGITFIVGGLPLGKGLPEANENLT